MRWMVLALLITSLTNGSARAEEFDCKQKLEAVAAIEQRMLLNESWLLGALQPEEQAERVFKTRWHRTRSTRNSVGQRGYCAVQRRFPTTVF